MSLNKNSVISGGELLQKDLVEKTSDTVCGTKDNVSNTLEDLSSGIISFAHGVKEKLSAYVGKDAPLSSEGINEHESIQETSSIAEKLQGTIDKLKLPFKVVLLGGMAIMLSGCLGKTAPKTDQELAMVVDSCASKGENYYFEGTTCFETRVDGTFDVWEAKIVFKNPEDIIIFVHGDLKDDKDFLSQHRLLKSMSLYSGGRKAVLLYRPDFKDSDSYKYGRTGKGHTPWETSPQYNAEIAGVFTQIKKRHGAENIYVVGQSNGAIITSIINAQHPGLIKGSMLYGGFYHMNSSNRSGNLGVTPTDNIGDIDKDTSVMVARGENDHFFNDDTDSLYYSKKLEKAGVKSLAYQEIPNAGHNLNSTSVEIAMDFFFKKKDELAKQEEERYELELEKDKLKKIEGGESNNLLSFND